MPSEPGLIGYKLASALLTFGIGLGGVLLPWALRSNERALSNGNMLSAGVMLGGGLLHLLPDAVEDLNKSWGGEFPLAYLLFALGLLLPLIVESLLLGDVHGDIHVRHISTDENWDELNDGVGEAASAPNQSLCCPNRRRGAAASVIPSSAPGGGASELHRAPRHSVPLSSALVLLGALSFHSVLEGLAQGAVGSLSGAMVMLGAIGMHKGLAAFALGCLLVDSPLPRQTSLSLGVGFACMTPLGTLFGMAAVRGGEEGEDGVLSSALVAMAGGSFTFVSLLEILPREMMHRHPVASPPSSKGMQVALLLLGFGAMALLAVWL